jgi:TPR repeat protein
LGEGDACYSAGRLVATPRNWHLDPNVTGIGRGDSAITAALSAINVALAEAARLFQLGCYSERRPSSAACSELGDSYTFGLGVPIQPDSSIKMYERGCALNSASACSRWAARLDDHPELGPQRRILAYQLVQRACDGGSPTGCANVAYVTDTALFRTRESDRHTSAFRRKAELVSRGYRDACEKGIAISCNNVGALMENDYGLAPGLSVAQRRDSARHYYELACEGPPIRVVQHDTIRARGIGFACRNIGNLSLYAVPPDTAAALVQYRRGCLLFDGVSCAELALKEYMLHPNTAAVALLRSVTACNEGLGLGCNYAGWLLRQPAFVDRVDESLVYFRRACDLSYAWSCKRLGDLETTAARQAKYHRRACELHEGSGCFGLASILEEKFGLQPRALIFFERACDEGTVTGCWEAKRIHRASGDMLNEGLDRARACRLDKQYCKKPDPSS